MQTESLEDEVRTILDDESDRSPKKPKKRDSIVVPVADTKSESDSGDSESSERPLTEGEGNVVSAVKSLGDFMTKTRLGVSLLVFFGVFIVITLVQPPFLQARGVVLKDGKATVEPIGYTRAFVWAAIPAVAILIQPAVTSIFLNPAKR